MARGGGVGGRVVLGRLGSRRRLRRGRRLWRVKKFPFYVPQTRWGLLRLISTYRLSLRQVSGGVPMTLFRYRFSASIFRRLYTSYPLVVLGRVVGIDQFIPMYRLLLEASLRGRQVSVFPVRRSIGMRLFPNMMWLASFLGGGSFMLCGGGLRWLAVLNKIVKRCSYLSLLGVRLNNRTVSYLYFFRQIALGRRFYFIKNFVDNLKFMLFRFVFRIFYMLKFV